MRYCYNSPLRVFVQPSMECLSSYQVGLSEHSTKMFLLMHIIDMSVCIGDKLLVYR